MKYEMDSNNKKETYLQYLLRINPNMPRLQTLLTEQEIESLRNLKKQRAIQINKLLKESKKSN